MRYFKSPESKVKALGFIFIYKMNDNSETNFDVYRLNGLEVTVDHLDKVIDVELYQKQLKNITTWRRLELLINLLK